ncbi:MAG: MerR family DNA-binding transcriptional regulator [Candidatus Nephthysia bennettiae]|nr:MAG: MerR family DNA-binding transcriptional regulator [Candidatus Dormibacteraeota bacterium]
MSALPENDLTLLLTTEFLMAERGERTWVQEGKLRAYRLEAGGHRRFKREDLDRLLTEEPRPEP